MPTAPLPTVKVGKKTYFIDERLGQIRNVNNPHDFEDVDQDVIDHWKAMQAAFDRGYNDRMTGHDPDLPLESRARNRYRAGYRKADKEIHHAL